MEKLTQEILKELLHYEPSTGIFTWKERFISHFSHRVDPGYRCNIWNKKYANQEAGVKYKQNKNFYIVVDIIFNKNKWTYSAHRLAFLYLEGKFPPEYVDHIDGDGTNNKRNNLREVTNQENLKNQSMYSNNKSGCTGVYWIKETKKWRVSIGIDGKSKYGGQFENKEDAIAKRKEMEIKYGFHETTGENKEK